MVEILTPRQKLLNEYLEATGMNPLDRLLTVEMLLWEEEATEEMLKYIAKTRESDPAKLYSTALEISKKYTTEEDETD